MLGGATARHQKESIEKQESTAQRVVSVHVGVFVYPSQVLCCMWEEQLSNSLSNLNSATVFPQKRVINRFLTCMLRCGV